MYPLRSKGNCRAFVLVLPVCSDHLEPSSHSTSDDLHFSYKTHCMSQVSKKTTNLQPTYIHLGSLFPWICWNIWLARNKQIFENRNFEAAEVLVKSIINARVCQGAQPDPPPILQTLTSQHNRLLHSRKSTMLLSSKWMRPGRNLTQTA